MVRLVAQVLVIVALLAASTGSAEPPILAVKAHIDLTVAADGYTGRLELLEDARITPQLEKDMWQSGGPEMALDPSDPLLKRLETSPLSEAVLRLRDDKGGIVAEKSWNASRPGLSFINFIRATAPSSSRRILQLNSALTPAR